MLVDTLSTSTASCHHQQSRLGFSELGAAPSWCHKPKCHLSIQQSQGGAGWAPKTTPDPTRAKQGALSPAAGAGDRVRSQRGAEGVAGSRSPSGRCWWLLTAVIYQWGDGCTKISTNCPWRGCSRKQGERKGQQLHQSYFSYYFIFIFSWNGSYPGTGVSKELPSPPPPPPPAPPAPPAPLAALQNCESPGLAGGCRKVSLGLSIAFQEHQRQRGVTAGWESRSRQGSALPRASTQGYFSSIYFLSTHPVRLL